MSNEKVKIKLEDVINHLNNGVTRKISSKNYNSEIGSIQEIYGLPTGQVDKLFKSEHLKGIRVKPTTPDMFELILPEEEPIIGYTPTEEFNADQEEEIAPSEEREVQPEEDPDKSGELIDLPTEVGLNVFE